MPVSCGRPVLLLRGGHNFLQRGRGPNRVRFLIVFHSGSNDRSSQPGELQVRESRVPPVGHVYLDKAVVSAEEGDGRGRGVVSGEGRPLMSRIGDRCLSASSSCSPPESAPRSPHRNRCSFSRISPADGRWFTPDRHWAITSLSTFNFFSSFSSCGCEERRRPLVLLLCRDDELKFVTLTLISDCSLCPSVPFAV